MSQTMDVGQDGDELHFSVARVMMLVGLPALTTALTGFLFSAAALHYRDQGWEVWHLGLMVSAGYVIRPMMNSVIAYAGSWVAAPLYGLCALLVLPACLVPDMELFVNIEAATAMGLHALLAIQGLCYTEFSHSDKVLSRASRVQTLSVTIGYAVSPFVGGVLYDFGGWVACAWFHFFAYVVIVIMFCTNPIVIEEFRGRREAEEDESEPEDTESPYASEKPHASTAARTSAAARASAAMGPSPHASPAARASAAMGSLPIASAAAARASTAIGPVPSGRDSKWRHSRKRRSMASVVFPAPELADFWPSFVCSFAFGVNGLTYLAEYSTYALYFREVHNWQSSSLAGFAQMVGDVVGAIVLVASAFNSNDDEETSTTGSSTSPSSSRWSVYLESKFGESSIFQGSLRRPYHIAWLLVAYVFLNLGLTLPSLFVAVSCAIIMGTVFVYFIQWVNEMNMLYAFGDQEVYMRLQAFSLAFYSVGCAVSGWGSVYLYDEMGPLSPFYACAWLCTLTLFVYVLCFWLRVGCGKSINAVEHERRLKTLRRESRRKSSIYSAVSNQSLGAGSNRNSYGHERSSLARSSARKSCGRESLFWRGSVVESECPEPNPKSAGRAQHESKKVDYHDDWDTCLHTFPSLGAKATAAPIEQADI